LFVATVSEVNYLANMSFFLVGCSSSLIGLFMPMLVGLLYPILERKNQELTPKIGSLGGAFAALLASILFSLIVFGYRQLLFPQMSQLIRPDVPYETIKQSMGELYTGVTAVAAWIGTAILNGVFGAVGGFVGTYFVTRKKTSQPVVQQE